MSDAVSPKETPVLATFEITAREGADMEEALRLQENLHEIARSTPSIGEIESSSWTNEEGTTLVLYTFKSMAAMRQFIRHPEHLAVMKRGTEFFDSIKTRIAPIEKLTETDFKARAKR